MPSTANTIHKKYLGKTRAQLIEELEAMEARFADQELCLQEFRAESENLTERHRQQLAEVSSRYQNINDEDHRQIEMLLNQASALARVGHWVFDHLNNDLSYWSEGMIDIFGLKPSSKIGFFSTANNNELIHAEDRLRVLKHFESFEISGENFDIQYRIIRNDRELCWIQETGTGVEWIGRKCIRSVGTVRDITEQKRIEKELFEEAERFRLTIKAVSSGFWDWNLVTGDMVSSDSWVEVLGYEPEEIESNVSFWETLIHPDDREGVLASLDEFLKNDEDFYRYSYRMRQKSGEYRWIMDQGRVIEFDESGKPSRMIGTDTDITEQRNLEEALKENRARFQSILDFSPVSISLKDMEGNYLVANKQQEKLLNIAAEDIVGKNTKNVLPEGLLESALAQEREMLETLQPSVREHRFHVGDREITTLASKFFIMDEEQNPAGIGTIATDITELIQTEAELKNLQQDLIRSERLATLGQLTATVSHELRNPLGAMRPSLYLLQKRLPTDDERLIAAFERLDRNIERCDQIIDQMLDFTRIQGIDRQTLELDAWITEELDDMEIPDGIDVKLEPGLTNQEFSFDPERLRRALINVYDNACQAMAMLENDAQATDAVDRQLLVKTQANDQRIEIVVSDTGPGISEDELARIFEPLYSTKGFGVGLGLSAVQQAMQQHGGDVEVFSTEGKGTRFILWLPLPEKSEVPA